jgi:cytochrome b subunit of formate dehydrogenase
MISEKTEEFKNNTNLPSKSEENEVQIERFSRLNRVLHVCMVVSFISLALTGMTLKFSYTGWAVFLSKLFGGFESAGYIHRFAAVIMFTVFISHIVDLIRINLLY